MKRICGETILSFYLLVASVHGTSNPSAGSPSELLIYNGNLSPEGEFSSPSEVMSPKVISNEEGIFPVTGELQVSHDLSDHGVNDDGFSGKAPTAYKKRRSVTIIKSADKVAQIANETCRDVNKIDEYVQIISSQSTLMLLYNGGDYNNIIQVYNDNVRIAQRNTNKWKGESGILADITDTFLLTKEFEPKFRDCLQRMEKRVAALLKTKEVEILNLKSDMDRTNIYIKTTEEVLEKTVDKKVNELVRENITNTLAQKKDKLRRLVTQYNKAWKEEAFQETLEVLEYVRNNSIEIQEKVNATKNEMENFKSDAMQDSGRFKRSRQLAAEGLQTLKNERSTNNEEINNTNADKVKLRVRIRTEMSKLRTAELHLHYRKYEFELEVYMVERAVRAAEDKAFLGKLLLIIPIAGWIAGGIIWGLGNSERNAALRQKTAVINHHYAVVNNFEKNIARLNREIRAADRKITTSESKIRSLEEELTHLTGMDSYFQRVKDSVDSILPFLTEAIASLEKMGEVFQETHRDLNTAILEAGKAHTKPHKRVVIISMNDTIDMIKKHWENARDKIISVGECVKTKYSERALFVVPRF